MKDAFKIGRKSEFFIHGEGRRIAGEDLSSPSSRLPGHRDTMSSRAAEGGCLEGQGRHRDTCGPHEYSYR